MTTRSALQKVFEGMKRKSMRPQERINHTRKIVKQERKRRWQGETTMSTKIQESVHSIQS